MDRAGPAMGRHRGQQTLASRRGNTWGRRNHLSWRLRSSALTQTGPPRAPLVGRGVLTEDGGGGLGPFYGCALRQDRKPSNPAVNLFPLPHPADPSPLFPSCPPEGMSQHEEGHEFSFSSGEHRAKAGRGLRKLPAQAGNSQTARKEEWQEMSFQSPSWRRITQSSPLASLGSPDFQLL